MTEGKPRKPLRRIAGEIAVVVLCLAGLAAIFGLPAILHELRDVDPQAAKVDELVRELRAGEIAKAYGCTEDGFREKVGLERFGAVLDGIPFRRATDHEVRYRGQSSTRGGSADVSLQTDQGPVDLVFHVYRPVTGMDFLVSDILAGDRSLFAAELGD